MVRNSTKPGSRVEIQVGLGSRRSYLSLEQDYDIILFAPSGGTRVTTIVLSSDQTWFNAPNAFTNNSVVTGTINTSIGLDVGSKSPKGLLQIEM
jgi:hypothetical protein